MSFALTGYSVACIAFAFLGLLCIASWRGRTVGAVLSLACVITALWSGVMAASAAGATLTPAQIFLVEVLRNAAWLMFLVRSLPKEAWGSVGGIARIILWAGCALALAKALSVDSLADAASGLILFGLGSAVLGLVLLEQIFRNTRPENRSSVTFLLVGVGGLLVYDLFLYSEAALFRQIEAELWGARGFANALMVPVLAIAARRNPQLSVNLFVSRHVTFYTAALMGTGIYLLVMAAAGYGLRFIGGAWGTTLQIVFLFGAVILLAMVLLSSNLRAHMKVFIAKHFYANKYEYREEWLALTSALDAGGGELEKDCIRAIARIVGAEGGTLWLRRDLAGGESFLEKTETWNLADAPDRLDSDDPLVRFMGETQWSVHVQGWRKHPGDYEGFSLPGWLLDVGRDSLAVPLLRGRILYGVLVLRDPSTSFHLGYEEIDLLKIAGHQVATALAQARTSRLLTESRQFEAYNRLTAFLMHDLKNLIAQQSLVVRNAGKHKHNPVFVDDAIETIENSVERMQRLLDQLQRGSDRERRETVDPAELVRSLAAAHADRSPAAVVETCTPDLTVRANRDRLAMVISHLVRNAQEATSIDGRVAVDVLRDADQAVIRVTDTGGGMTAEFLRDRLFRPFDSTKGAKGMGIGAYQVRQYVEELGGGVRVQSSPGAGTVFEIRLPLENVLSTEEPTGDLVDVGSPEEARIASG